MNEKYKQRIIGAIVIFALLSLLLPILLRNNNLHNQKHPAIKKVNFAQTASKANAVNAAKVAQEDLLNEANAFDEDQNFETPPRPSPSNQVAKPKPQQVVNKPSHHDEKRVLKKAKIISIHPHHFRTESSLRKHHANKKRKPHHVSSVRKHHQHKKALAKSTKPLFIQLGLFSHHRNAQKLVAKLQAKGFPAYLFSKETSHRKLFRVVVGPVNDYSKAKQISNHLKKRFHINGVIVQG